MSIKHIHEDIRETHILGGKTRAFVVRADGSDTREWLAGSPICGCLNDYRIAHCSIMQASHPFEIVRVNLSGTFFLSCLEGEGNVLIDGRLVRLQEIIDFEKWPPFNPSVFSSTDNLRRANEFSDK